MKCTPTIVLALCALAAPCLASAKLPALSDDAKAKAAEATAKTNWGNAVANFQLCKSMDRVAAVYQADAKKAGKAVNPPAATPPCADPGPFAYAPPPAPGSAGASAAPAAAMSPAAPVAASAPAKK